MKLEAKIDLYLEMLRIRLIEESIALEYPKGEIRCPVHLSVGQELLPSLMRSFMCADDLVLSTHRSHAHYLAKGGNLRQFIAELYGKEDGCSSGNGGSMHLIDLSVGFMGSTAIVGNTIPVGVGLALASKIKNLGNVCFIYIGDAATEEGVFYESINFAAVKNLPVVFLCENNGYSVYTPIQDRQPARAIADMVAAHGIRSVKLNESNLENVAKTIGEVVKFTRQESMPSFIEIDTFRFLEHCGPANDDSLGYRSQEFVESKIAIDPLTLLERDLESNYPAWKEFRAEKVKVIRQEITDAFTFAKNSPYPAYSKLRNQVFG
jgi:pyruvate dehydrogenase E1 component alpha subunit